jgi:predicted nucleic acid-binding protein
LGLIVTGVVGVLGRAKRAALVPQVRPLLDELESGLGFFLKKNFKERSLRALGE